jgi:TolB-like protein
VGTMAASVGRCRKQAAGCRLSSVGILRRSAASRTLLNAFLLIAVPSFSALAGEYERMATELCRAAQHHGKIRVAVLPFENVGKRSAVAGGIISEKLVSAVLARDEVEVVERTLLASVLREQKLMNSGAVDARSIKELGRILGVEALIGGTVMELQDGRFEVNGRLIETQTARILGAVVAKVNKDWAESLFDDFSFKATPSWVGSDTATYAAEAGARDCRQAASDTEAMDRAILEIKARYWAGRLKDQDIESGSLERNPGSEIHDPETRREFYLVLRNDYLDPGMRRVTRAEFERMVETQKEIDRLAESCGLENGAGPDVLKISSNVNN